MFAAALRRRAAVLTVLALVFLGAESFALVHAADLDAHTAGDSCNACLSAAAFAGADAPQHASFVAIVVPQSSIAAVVAVPRSTLPVRRTARAPPFAS